MTEDELADDLGRLLREGLVVVDADQRDGFTEDPHSVPRFYVTPRGREELKGDVEVAS
jgi:hypothetical protein